MRVTYAVTRLFPMNTTRLPICGLVLLFLANAVWADEVVAPLADAAEKNDSDAAAALLAQGRGVNRPQVDGMTALHWAVYHDNEDLARRLVAAGADVAATNRYGVPPLSVACLNGNRSIVKLLLEAGADPQTELPGGETVLMTASRTGRLGPVEELLSRGADSDHRLIQGAPGKPKPGRQIVLVQIELSVTIDADELQTSSQTGELRYRQG